MQPVKKTSFAAEACPVARALDIIGDWWSLLIVREAMTGTCRFGEFAAHLGLAKNILTDRLRKLVAHEVLRIVPASDGSAYSEYAITEKGLDLFHVLVALRQWADRWVPGACDYTEVLVDLKNREPVAPLELHAADGRLLTIADVTIQSKEVSAPKAS